MNTMFCAVRITGEPIRKSELFSFIARIPRNIAVESVIEGPFAAFATTPPFSIRPLIGRFRHLIGVGDVRLDDRATLLRRLGGAFDSSSDIQLVLACIDAFGVDIVPTLLGDFSLVVWDARAHKVIAARDAFGVKQLFTRTTDGIVLFSTESAILGETDAYDTEFLSDFLTGTIAGADNTVWRGVTRIEPGTMHVQRGSVREKRTYWSATAFEPAREADEVEATRRFRSLFEDAVRSRTTTDGSTWAFLSGGLDSSSVVCTAERMRADSERPVLGGTLTYVDRLGDGDETRFSNLVVSQAGVRNELVHDFWPWRDDDFGAPLADEPHPFYTFYSRDRRISNVAQSGGARVLLSGFGSDHYLFGNLGYIPDLVATGRILSAAREVAAWSIAGRKSFWRMARQHAIQPLLRRRASHPMASVRFPGWLGTRQEPGPVLQRLMNEEPEPLRRMFASRAAREFATVSSSFERGVYDSEFEMRYPFLSRPLVEFSLQLPVHMRIRPFGRKWILRQAMVGVLPEPIRVRQAKGGIDSRIIWAMQQERARIDALLRNPILGDMGLVEPGALRRAVEETRCGEGHNLTLLMSALSLETWLAVRDGRWSTIRRAA